MTVAQAVLLLYAAPTIYVIVRLCMSLYNALTERAKQEEVL